MRDAGLEPGDDVRVRVMAPGRLELVRVDELAGTTGVRSCIATFWLLASFVPEV